MTMQCLARDMRVGDVISGLGPVVRITPNDVWFTNERGEERLACGRHSALPWTIEDRDPAPAPATPQRRRTPRANPEATSRTVDVETLAARPADWVPFTSTRTFGVELECYRPAGKSAGQLAIFLRANGVPCETGGGHDVSSKWKIVADRSLRANGSEIVSPILRGDDGLDQCRKVCAALVAFGCTVNLDCGYHVHIGVDPSLMGYHNAARPTPEAFAHLRRLAALWMRHESDLDGVLAPSRRGTTNRFCQSNRASAADGYSPADGERAFQKVMACRDMTELYRETQRGGRYYKFNMTTLRGDHDHMQPTVEFRHHSGTIDPLKVTHWVKLMVAFVDKAEACRPRAWDFSAEHGQRDSLRRLLRYVKPGADTHAFYMRRRLELAKAEGRKRATQGLGFQYGRAA